MLHLLYILAFTALAFFAVANLIRSLITLSTESQRLHPPANSVSRSGIGRVPHPEFLDDDGNVVNEPLLVMKSMTVEDARSRLDALYNSSPSASGETSEGV